MYGKKIQQLINNSTRINPVFWVLKTVNLLLLHAELRRERSFIWISIVICSKNVLVNRNIENFTTVGIRWLKSDLIYLLYNIT